MKPAEPEEDPAILIDEGAQSLGEEVANVISHGLGLLAVLVATPFLLMTAWKHGDVLGAGMFAASATLLYLASTLYHAAPLERKGFFRMLDHFAIFFLIAGTYSPFALGPLKGPLGYGLLAAVWALAVFGVLFKLIARFRFPYVSTGLYIAMGWLAVLILRPLAQHLPAAGLAWLVAGGLCYTGGVLFYHWERLRYAHLIWHLFVIGGTGCHFVAVYRYAV